MARPSEARLNLDAARHNIALARELAPQSRVMAVVKANAYGHGALTMARALAPQADALAVACLEEALELRESGIELPILLLEGVFQPEELAAAAHTNCWITIDNEVQLRWLEHARLPAPLHTWLKVDTGMHRLGVAPQRATEFYHRVVDSANNRGKPVLSTHFAAADELDCSTTRRQLALFEQATEGLAGARSAANSPGLLAWPASHYHWVRPGYMLWGNSPFGTRPHSQADRLRPVMTLCSAVISVRDVAAGDAVGYGASWRAARDSRIATITIGYGDGYPRTAASGTPVLINGQRAALAGRVSMDMITVDVTDLGEVRVGDPVVLWGEGLPIAEVAEPAATIGYELLARMPARVRRVVTAN
jgi:alanine racemase